MAVPNNPNNWTETVEFAGNVNMTLLENNVVDNTAFIVACGTGLPFTTNLAPKSNAAVNLILNVIKYLPAGPIVNTVLAAFGVMSGERFC